MVSMAITALLLTVLATLFSSITGIVDHSHDTTNAYDNVRSSTQLINRELSSTLVRDEPNRWLNFRVTEETGPGGGKRIFLFATVPEETIASTLSMSFINHVAYFWDEDTRSVHRATFNTREDPDILLATASSANNGNATANLNRLQQMTLAYRQSSAYGWTVDPLLTKKFDQTIDEAIITDVLAFEVDCYAQPITKGGKPTPTWNNPKALPSMVEIKIGIAHGSDADRALAILETGGERSEAKEHMQRFTLSIPMNGT